MDLRVLAMSLCGCVVLMWGTPESRGKRLASANRETVQGSAPHANNLTGIAEDDSRAALLAAARCVSAHAPLSSTHNQCIPL